MMISGTEIVVKCLEREGVVLTFGYPGAAICPFYNQLSQPFAQHVLVRQEQNAGHVASSHTRSSGKFRVCVATPSPGATGLITSIAAAYMDSVPLTAITGQVRSELFNRDVFQEVDITGACEPFTKRSHLVEDTADLSHVFKEALYIAFTGCPDSVLIDVPVDVQQNQIREFKYPQYADAIGYKSRTQKHVLQIEHAVETLAGAQRPLIYYGGGVALTGVRKELIGLAEKTGIPVIPTMMDIDVVPLGSDSYLGTVGSHGKKSVNQVLLSADVVILCDTRAGDRAITTPEMLGSESQITHINVDPTETGENIIAHIPIVGDIRLVLNNLADKVSNATSQEWLDRVQELWQADVPHGEPSQDYVEPCSFVYMFPSTMEDDVISVADADQDQIWSVNNSNIKEGRFLTSGGLGTMRYPVPVAIGVKPAEPRRQVVVVCSDDSFQVPMCELSTIMQSGVGIKIVVTVNRHLGVVREI